MVKKGLLTIVLVIFAALLFTKYFSQSNPPSPIIFSSPEPLSAQAGLVQAFDQLLRPYESCLISADTGDSGGAQIVKLMGELHLPCLIIAGDVIYPNGSSENFHEHVEPYLSPLIEEQAVFPVPGNHDWWKGYPLLTKVSYQADELPLCQIFSYLQTGQGKCRYYRLRLPTVEVFFFDSDFREPDGNTRDSTQGQWLKNALEDSSAAWKIVVTHEPPISSCQHEGSAAIANLPLKDWGADALITGHCHFYERSLYHGIPLLTIGNGGNSLYQFEKNNPDSLFRYNDGKGALQMTADEDNLTFNFVTVEGDTLDTLTLHK